MSSEIERMQALVRLALEWLGDSKQEGIFMPDPEGDKIARTRTQACAIALLRELSQERPSAARQPL
jgi:hypothetical protein